MDSGADAVKVVLGSESPVMIYATSDARKAELMREQLEPKWVDPDKATTEMSDDPAHACIHRGWTVFYIANDTKTLYMAFTTLNYMENHKLWHFRHGT